MDKNFTLSSTIFCQTASAPTAEVPSKLTIEKIRQFARAYSYAPVKISSLGGVVLN